MQELFRKIRGIVFINAIVRKVYLLFQEVLHLISHRWRVSGIVQIKIEGVSFQYFSKCDDVIVDQLFYSNYDEYTTLKLYCCLAKKSQVIVDVGANTGLYSIVGALSAKSAKVFSFEPYRANFNRLNYNIGLNNLFNISTIEMALGNNKGVIDFYVPKYSERISQVSSVNKHFSEAHRQNGVSLFERIEVDQELLDNLIIKDIKRIDLLKIDVESHEWAVLQGAINSIKSFRPHIICEIFYSNQMLNLLKVFVEEMNYHIYLITTDGIIKVQSLIETTSFRNYYLSPVSFNSNFIPIGKFKYILQE